MWWNANDGSGVTAETRKTGELRKARLLSPSFSFWPFLAELEQVGVVEFSI